eukprot:GHVP01055589.1.p2 GENE.GHVP01055589.1~~GHVP01055589.1.p2  ORF type:complete len:270 (+),score=39.64 GHVP01055589.1:1191-2000(+)
MSSELLTFAKSLAGHCAGKYTKTQSVCAIDTDKGIFGGVLWESCAYPTTIPAVQGAICNALSNGATEVKAAVFWSDSEKHPDSLQFLAELGAKSLTVVQGDKESVMNLKNTKPVKRAFPSTKLSKDLKFLKEEELPQVVRDTDIHRKAIDACQLAHVPVSNFPVGAAFVTGSGAVVSGANVESALSIEEGLCAERCAASKIATSGERSIKAGAVVCYKLPDYGRPCGGCRQVIGEFGNFPVVMLKVNADDTVDYHIMNSHDLLPHPFFG